MAFFVGEPDQTKSITRPDEPALNFLPNFGHDPRDCSRRDAGFEQFIRSTGAKRGRMKVSARNVALLNFDLAGIPKTTNIRKAELLLYTTARQYRATDIGVFRAAPEFPPAPPAKVTGIADNYPGDVGLGRDKQVVFTDNFEAPLSVFRWSGALRSHSFDRVDNDQPHEFVPHSGKALRVRVKAGKHLGLNLRYKFLKNIGSEPEEIYFRYYLRLTKS